MDPSLQAFFHPLGVAVVGASSNPEKLGYGVARNLIDSGHRGVIHLVNRHGGNLFGRPLLRSLADAPDPLDLAVLIVPAADAPQALRDCVARGVQAAILISSGFRETGGDGAALEAECAAIARTGGLRLLGPNCIGLLDTHLPLDTTFLAPPGAARGELAFVSHSGAICAALIDWARAEGFGFSRLISLGNQADVNECDVLPAFIDDQHTRVVTLYLEGVADGARFLEAAGDLSRVRPVVALKVGRSPAGRRAAASHTGALAGEQSAYQAAFARAGVLQAATTEEMFDWARALACAPLPRGPRMAVLTNAGGPGVIAADALAANGLELSALGAETHAALAGLLPPAASLHNPVDMLASATPDQYAACLSLLLADPGVDGVLVVLPPPPVGTAAEIAASLVQSARGADKPICVALTGGQAVRAAEGVLRAARLPAYPFPERAAAALRALTERAAFLARPARDPAPPAGIDLARARQALADQPSAEWLPQPVLDELLAAAGITGLPLHLARSAEQAAALAEQIGFPLVMKVASPDIPHKSDVHGVLLDIRSASAAYSGYAQLIERASALRPDAILEGVHLQPMLPDGQDLILGVKRDATFGPLVLFGLGGVEVEARPDVAVDLCPLDPAEAAALVGRTWAGRRLDGFRSTPPADRAAVLETLGRLSHLAAGLPELAELEINPLRALAPGQGVRAVDVRARLV